MLDLRIPDVGPATASLSAIFKVQSMIRGVFDGKAAKFETDRENADGAVFLGGYAHQPVVISQAKLLHLDQSCSNNFA